MPNKHIGMKFQDLFISKEYTNMKVKQPKKEKTMHHEKTNLKVTGNVAFESWEGGQFVRVDLKDAKTGKVAHLYVEASQPLATLAVGKKLKIVNDR